MKRIQHVARDPDDHRLLRDPPHDVLVRPLPPARHVVRIQRIRQLDVTVGVEPPRELPALILQVRLHRGERQRFCGRRVLVRVRRDPQLGMRGRLRRLVFRRVARALGVGSARVASAKLFIRARGRPVRQHRGHPRRGEPTKRRIPRVVLPAVPPPVRHDREPLALADPGRPVGVPPAPGDETQLAHERRVRRAPLEREHASHAPADRELDPGDAHRVQEHLLQPHVVADRARRREVGAVGTARGGGIHRDRGGGAVRGSEVVDAHDEVFARVHREMGAVAEHLAPPLVHATVRRQRVPDDDDVVARRAQLAVRRVRADDVAQDRAVLELERREDARLHAGGEAEPGVLHVVAAVVVAHRERGPTGRATRTR
eukprot:29225-Pelagococcus_subviridis.AAC.6